MSVADLVMSTCGHCGRKGMLTYTGEGKAPACDPCYKAYHARAEPPTKRGYPCKPEGCRHGVRAAVVHTDGAGRRIKRTTCCRCGHVERTRAA